MFAFPIGNEITDPTQMYLEDIYTVLANLTGNPAISVPSSEKVYDLHHSYQLMSKTLKRISFYLLLISIYNI